VRVICKYLNSPAAAPHVLAGVTSVLTLPSPASVGEQDRAKDKKDKVPALLAAMFLFIRTRLVGQATSGKEYTKLRQLVLNALARARADQELGEKIYKTGNVSKDKEWEKWEDVSTKDIDAWLLEVSSKGWLQLDWFGNIVEGSGLEADVPEGADEADEADELMPDVADPEGNGTEEDMSQDGLGTMMQDRVDYLSEKKRAEYKVWKDGIMARIEELEAMEAEKMDTED
jgi:origin recognition complex subunit 6